MKFSTVILYVASATLLMPAYANAQDLSADDCTISGMKAEWTAQNLRMSFSLKEAKGEGSAYAVFDTPRITTAEGDTLLLESMVFRGKKNMRYVERERHFAGKKRGKTNDRMARKLQSSPKSWLATSGKEMAIGETAEYNVNISRKSAPWLWSRTARLEVKREKDGCCSTQELTVAHAGELKYIEPFVPTFAAVEDNTGKAGELQKNNPVLHHISEYKPYTKDRILRKEKGALYVHFNLDKSELRHDYRSNAQTLDRIVDITRQIMADTTSSVKIIQIVGLLLSKAL